MVKSIFILFSLWIGAISACLQNLPSLGMALPGDTFDRVSNLWEYRGRGLKMTTHQYGAGRWSSPSSGRNR